jgi:acetamidase/formamidase
LRCEHTFYHETASILLGIDVMKSLTALAIAFGLAGVTVTLSADTHRFVPTAFYKTIASEHPPALRLKSGDRVSTSTTEELTGPFYVEGAEPGDLLVVTIETLTPNAATGFSTSVMAANAIDAGSITSKPDSTRFPWTIDKEKGVVRLDLHAVSKSTDWKSRFTAPAFEMPLEPSLRSIGVASSPTQGGNLIASGVGAGAKAMLPVFQQGALLFLGHGQARQGDGDVTGAGIETSLDVEFTVDVVKKKSWPHSSVVRPSTVVGEFEMGWPRIETADYLMAVGTAPSLQQALQHATIELHHWLDDDFGLSEKSVSLFVGQAIEYEIASIEEPTMTVVAKVRKAYLPPAAP